VQLEEIFYETIHKDFDFRFKTLTIHFLKGKESRMSPVLKDSIENKLDLDLIINFHFAGNAFITAITIKKAQLGDI
jgi:hypothetical protein